MKIFHKRRVSISGLAAYLTGVIKYSDKSNFQNKGLIAHLAQEWKPSFQEGYSMKNLRRRHHIVLRVRKQRQRKL